VEIRAFLLGGVVGAASSLCLFATVRAAAPNGAPSMSNLLYAAADICSGMPKSDEAPFMAENNAAMAKMMAGMNVAPSGDVDADFTAMMIPHHQGAIDMAMAELRFGRNEQLRRISQEIIVDQQQEIAAMRLALGLPLPAEGPASTQVVSGGSNVAASQPRPEPMSPTQKTP
jgi:hypothetical protein